MEDAYYIHKVNDTEIKDEYVSVTSSNTSSTKRNLFGLLPMSILILVVVLRISWTLCRSLGQKTRSAPQRRMYVGSRPRQSLPAQEPTIYISPSNLPPPPKYECMAPPSYDEVVGVHYPGYNAQPISQPISAALAQGSAQTDNVTSTSITVVNEPRRTSVTVART